MNAVEDAVDIIAFESNQNDLKFLGAQNNEFGINFDKVENCSQKDLEEDGICVETLRSELTELKKKQRDFEKNVRLSERHARKFESKYFKLLNEVEGKEYEIKDLKKKNLALENELCELEHFQEDAYAKVEKLENQNRSIEIDLDEQKNYIVELENELQNTKNDKIRLESNIKALKTKFKHHLLAIEEDAEANRKDFTKKLHDIKAEINDERKTRLAAVITINELNGKQSELINEMSEIKVMHNAAERDADEVKTLRDEAVAVAMMAERKLKNIKSKLFQIQEKLCCSLRVCPAIESSNEEYTEDVSNCLGIQIIFVEAKRILDDLIKSLEEKIDVEQFIGEMHSEMYEKATHLNEDLRFELQVERVTNKNLERSRALLEQQNNELTQKFSKLETNQKMKAKEKFDDLERKLVKLTEQLEVESNERFAQQSLVRMKDKKIKDLLFQLDIEKENSNNFNEQIEMVNARVLALKSHLNKAEEEIFKEKKFNRKLQRDKEDLEDNNDCLAKEIETLKNKLK